MAEIILAILILVVCMIIPRWIFPDMKKRDGTIIKRSGLRMLIRTIGIIFALIILILSCITTVHTGYTGIVTKFNQVQEYTYEAGLHLKSPFVKVIEMDNREQRVPFEMEAFSADIQEVQVTGSVNYSIDKTTAMRLYREVGTDYANILLSPRTKEVLKSCFAGYTAEGLIANRQELSQQIYAKLKEDLAPQGINIITVSIENVDFTDAFTNAVEAKQVATQEKQRAETQQEQQTMEAKQAAERKQIAAEADAAVAKVQADAEAYAVQVKAEAEAEANKKLSASLTAELIEYTQINNWNGELPHIVGSGTTIPILDVTNEE